MMNLEDKINIVKEILKDKKVTIGFSGGADSTLIAYLSSKFAQDTLAITIDNHLMPSGFIEHTQRIAEKFEIRHEIIDLNFFENEKFLENGPKRCYYCRNWMYTHITDVAKKKGFDFICDGNNISDLVIDRPGILITYKKGFNTPFIEAKLTSKEIHEYLNRNNIPFSKSTTCLATRIPTNTPTTKEKIRRISDCEDYIYKNTNCEIVKVRDLGKFGICEVDNLNEMLKTKKYIKITEELKRKGFRKVALNLSEINDDEFISVDYHDGSFSYQLPFTINIENTKKQLQKEIIFDSFDRININKVSIFENGLIMGHYFENYESALDTFMEILPKIRRNIEYVMICQLDTLVMDTGKLLPVK